MLQKTSRLLLIAPLASALAFSSLALAQAKRKPSPPAAARPAAAKPAPAAAGPRFVDVTARSGIEFTHTTGAFGRKWLPETMGAGVLVFDANGDDRPDILFLNGKSFPGHGSRKGTQELYVNRGGMKFENATARSGLAAVDAYCMGGAAGDLDNDGDADLYVSCLGQDLLLRNDGGRFVDVSRKAGLSREYEFGSSVALFDADRDGFLDVLATRYVTWTPETDLFCSLDGKSKSYCTPESYPGASPRFYRNRGNGTFEDRTRQAGFFKPASKSLGLVVFDLDADGWPDVAVANDTQPNLLFRNRGNGTFEEIGVSSGMAFSETGIARAGMGIDAGDYNRSGRLSLVIGNFANERAGLYRNQGNQLFVDVAAGSEVGRRTLLNLCFGTFFFDYDLDGWLDLLLANGHIDAEIENVQSRVKYRQPTQLFRNQGRGHYAEVTQGAGGDLAKPRVARGAAHGDFDGDGDLDVVITNNGGPGQLFANQGSGHGNWLRVALRGTRTNRDGVGALVEVAAGGAVQRSLVRIGSSYLSQSQLEPTFGLGAATRADRVTIRWPTGRTQTLTNIRAGQRIEVREGGG